MGFHRGRADFTKIRERDASRGRWPLDCLIDSAAHRGIFIGRNPYRRPTTGLEHQTRTSKPRQTTIFLPHQILSFLLNDTEVFSPPLHSLGECRYDDAGAVSALFFNLGLIVRSHDSRSSSQVDAVALSPTLNWLSPSNEADLEVEMELPTVGPIGLRWASVRFWVSDGTGDLAVEACPGREPPFRGSLGTRIVAR